MPTYDYECKTCEHLFEFFQSMSDDPLMECPECGGTLRRLIGGGSGFIFKGSGFYINDAKRGGSSSTGSSVKKDDSSKKSTPSQKKPSPEKSKSTVS